MDFDFLSGFGWRECLMALIALLVIYMAVAYGRMRRLKRGDNVDSQVPPVFSPSSAVAAYQAEQVPTPEAAQASAPEAKSGFQFPWEDAAGENPFVKQIAALESEVEQLRREVGGLRAEVLVLREMSQRVLSMPKEEPKPTVAQAIAPQYSEALQLALKDVDAAEISHQCGITRAEAELVAALVKNRDN